MLRTLLASKNGSGAFDHLAAIWLDYGEHSARIEIRDVVCTDYWLQAGEYFTLEGELGWGPGHREWDQEDLDPPLMQGAVQKLRQFLHRLAALEPTPILTAIKANPSSVAGSFFERMCLVRRLGQTKPGQDKTLEYKILEIVYSRIANHRSHYELGGARAFLKLWMETGKFQTAVAGLINVLVYGLPKEKVMATPVTRTVTVASLQEAPVRTAPELVCMTA